MYVVNVKYSENLGDGVIAECIEKMGFWGDKKPVSFDLSSKGSYYSKSGLKSSGRVVRFFRGFKKLYFVVCLLNLIYGLKLLIRFSRMEPAKLVVFGGGQIVSGAEFFFPGRILFIFLWAKYVWRANTVFYGVGVAESFGFFSREVYRFILIKSSVYVRDEESSLRVKVIFGVDSEIVTDPGICASCIYSAASECSGAIGVCVTHPDSLALHDKIGSVYGVDFYVSLVERLVAEGFNVKLYCNGLREDFYYQELVMKSIGSEYSDCIEFINRPTKPSELVSIISSFKVVLSHRLHSCIVAYSFGIPVLGFEWDSKLESFFNSISLTNGFVRKGTSSEGIVEMVKRISNDYDLNTVREYIDCQYNFHSALLGRLHSGN